ncbi:MAG: hypothetical protein KBT03_03850 [Bacteroidales bacterium]|nr:hypothetical protein [Candidatus Scybalousia scybalohippi]
MGLLGGTKETKEQKELRKAMEVMQKYGLENIDAKYVEQVKKINLELAGTGAMEFGTLLSGKPEDKVKMAYLNTLIQQNWIIIRMLDELNKK